MHVNNLVLLHPLFCSLFGDRIRVCACVFITGKGLSLANLWVTVMAQRAAQ